MGRRKQNKGKPRAPKPRELTEQGTINDDFLNYYKLQFVPNVLSEEEYDQMIAVLRTSLPHVFRVSPCCKNPEIVEKDLNKFISTLNEIGIDIQKLTLLGDGAGSIYQMSVDKPTFRKDPNLRTFHEWLKVHEGCGDISRQELVSMIPPYFLDVAPEHLVLDMCAAPGSKTTQVLEMMLKQAPSSGTTGLVIANEVNAKRCRTLAGRLQRLDNRQTIVVSHWGQWLPHVADFDRIVCDVPCSGDGTLRKSPDAGPKWKVTGAQGLHKEQRAILTNALKLLKVGGRVVYSTCSFNPIEDEAVIASVVNDCKGAVEIVDVSDRFPELKYSPGMKTWSVCSMDGPLKSFEDVPESLKNYIPASMFPVDVPEEITRCMRFLPHLNNTGGFFVTVLEKKAEITIPIPMNPRAKGDWNEPPFVPIEAADTEVDTFSVLKEEFGLKDSFKKENCFTRSEKQVHSICLLNDSASKVTRETECKNLRSIACGARVFSWKKLSDTNAIHGTPCFEGIDISFEAATKRKFAATPEDVKNLLVAGNAGVAFDNLSKELGDAVRSAPHGGVFVYIEGTNIRYGGMINKLTLALHVKKGVIKFELAKLKEQFPDIVIEEVKGGAEEEEKKEE